MFKTPILMLKMTFFWLLFRGKFEQKTQKSISFKNQWRLKNIKKAMVVKNIIAEDMPFTKSIFEQFWRSYYKKTIFVVFHFLKFLPYCNCYNYTRCRYVEGVLQLFLHIFRTKKRKTLFYKKEAIWIGSFWQLTSSQVGTHTPHAYKTNFSTIDHHYVKYLLTRP